MTQRERTIWLALILAYLALSFWLGPTPLEIQEMVR